MAAEPAPEPATAAEGAAGGRPRRELVALLLAMLKEYYLKGQDDTIRQMYRDIADGGCKPRPLGKWGLVRAAEVGDAVAEFEAWKSQGCLFMPAKYSSVTHNQEIECLIRNKNPDGSLDLEWSNGAEPFVKRKAETKRVARRSPAEGWFVPPPRRLGLQAGILSAAPAPAAASSTPATAGATSAVHTVTEASHTPTTVPEARVLTVTHGFDGTGYGPEYLVLNVGDQIVWLEQDQGWAKAKVLRRQVHLPPDHPGAALETGWYPPAFAS